MEHFWTVAAARARTGPGFTTTSLRSGGIAYVVRQLLGRHVDHGNPIFAQAHQECGSIDACQQCSLSGRKPLHLNSFTAMASRASRSNSAGVWWRASSKVDGYSMCIDRFMVEGNPFGVCRTSHPASQRAGQGGKTYMAPTQNARKQIARLLERAKCLIPIGSGGRIWSNQNRGGVLFRGTGWRAAGLTRGAWRRAASGQNRKFSCLEGLPESRRSSALHLVYGCLLSSWVEPTPFQLVY